jgi:branched-chain amino acid transport system permease protein
MTGGITGVLNIPSPSIAGFDFGINQVPYFYLILGIAVVSVLVMYRMEHSRMGLTFHAMRQNDTLAQHLGVNIWRYRILCFTIACFFAGLVGAFQAHYWHYVSPATYTVMDSFYIFISAYVGGLMYPAGPIVGATLLVSLSEGLRMAKEWQPFLYGGFLIGVVFFLPGGILSLPQESRALLRQGRARLNSIRDRFARAPGS